MLNMLHCITGCRPKQWDLALQQVELALNGMVNRSFRRSPFLIVYTKVPTFTADLTTLSLFKSSATMKSTNDIQAMLEEVKQHLEYSNSKGKEAADKKRRAMQFSVGDLVMVYISEGRTPFVTYSKLQDRTGSFSGLQDNWRECLCP